MKKPYKSLSQQYVEMKVSKPAQPITESYTQAYLPSSIKQKNDKHKRAGSLSEAYEITVRNLATKEVDNIVIPSTQYRSVSRELYAHKHDLRTAITAWVEAANTGKATSRVASVVYDVIKPKMTKDKAVAMVAAIHNLTTKKSELINYTNSLVSAQSVYDIISEEDIAIFGGKVIEDISRITYGEGGRGVGAGELCMCLFSEAIFTHPGDIGTSNIFVEVKGSGGRPGINLDTIKRGVDYIKNHSHDEVFYTSKHDKAVSNIREALKGVITFNQSGELDGFQMTGPGKKLTLSTLKSIVIDGRIPSSDKKIWTTATQKVLLTALNERGVENADDVVKAVSTNIENAQATIQRGGASPAAIIKGFFPAVRPDPDTYASGILSFAKESNYSDNAEQVRDLIKQYIGTINYNQMISCFQFADYQAASAEKSGQKFTHLQFINDKTLACKTVGPFTESYIDNVRMMMDAITNFNVSAGTGGKGEYGGGKDARGGFAVTYNG